ncbi:MAG: thioredoxin family protein [Pirellulaceae bacterium]
MSTITPHAGQQATLRKTTMVLMSGMMLMSLVLTLGGCRSLGKSKADVYAEADSAFAPQTSLASEQPKQVPEYAKAAENPRPDASPQMNDSSIRLASAKIERVTPLRTLSASEDLDQIVGTAPGTVMLDFYADWCGPCRKQGKVLHELESFAAEHQAQIIKVDVDQHKAIAKQFDIGSLPTLVVIKDGEVVHRKVGLTDESRLRSMLQ